MQARFLLLLFGLHLTACAVTPRVPPALGAAGQPLPFSTSPFSPRDGTELYGFVLEDHSYGGGFRVTPRGPEAAGAARFVICSKRS